MSIYEKLRAARTKAINRSKDAALIAGVCNGYGSIRGEVSDVPEERQESLLAALSRIAAVTNEKTPVAFASIRRGDAAGRVYVNDEEIDDDDAAYVAERIANPSRANAKHKRPAAKFFEPEPEPAAKLDPVAIFAKWNAAAKRDDA